MTSVRQLYALQELDLVLDRLRKQLDGAEEELKTKVSLENLQTALGGEEEKLQEVEKRQKDNRLDAAVHRDRSETLETQLYDGSLTNARDLEALQQEAANVRQLLEQEEAAYLELSIQLEESQTRCADLGQELSGRRARWESRQVELHELVSQLSEQRTGFEAQREQIMAAVDQASLRRYETLRVSKKGLAIAKVERGLCQGCRMALPTHLQQQVRGGRQTVNCSSCGRMLFLG